MLSWYMQRDREHPLMTPSVVTLAVRWYMTYCRGQRGLSLRGRGVAYESDAHTIIIWKDERFIDPIICNCFVLLLFFRYTRGTSCFGSTAGSPPEQLIIAAYLEPLSRGCTL